MGLIQTRSIDIKGNTRNIKEIQYTKDGVTIRMKDKMYDNSFVIVPTKSTGPTGPTG
jgi:hypothetical protein